MRCDNCEEFKRQIRRLKAQLAAARAKPERLEEELSEAKCMWIQRERMYTRQLAAVRTALEDIAKQKLCDELTDEETVDMGDIEYGYDQVILVARKALAGEKE